MAKLIFKKSKSFTLVELLVAVSIFVVVVVIVIATLTMAVASKSKIKATDELRTEGGKVMAEIQNMVEKGNTTGGVRILDNAGADKGGATCNVAIADPGKQLISKYIDSAGVTTETTVKFVSSPTKQIQMKKVIGTHDSGFVPILSASLAPSNLEVTGKYRTSAVGCSTQAVQIVVKFTIEGKTTGYVGDVPTITLQSTFTPKYPAPDKAGDSR